jgi:hypothetical protein
LEYGKKLFADITKTNTNDIWQFVVKSRRDFANKKISIYKLFIFHSLNAKSGRKKDLNKGKKSFLFKYYRLRNGKKTIFTFKSYLNCGHNFFPLKDRKPIKMLLIRRLPLMIR